MGKILARLSESAFRAGYGDTADGRVGYMNCINYKNRGVPRFFVTARCDIKSKSIIMLILQR